MPKRVKRRRVHRGSMAGKAQKGNKVTYGEFGLVAMEASWITSNQIEAARIAMTRSIKRGGKVWIKIFPHKPVTRKPAETRMGAGKGSPEYWVAVVKPGRVMFELAGVSEDKAREAMRLAMHKLPVKCKFKHEISQLGCDVCTQGVSLHIRIINGSVFFIVVNAQIVFKLFRTTANRQIMIGHCTCFQYLVQPIRSRGIGYLCRCKDRCPFIVISGISIRILALSYK